jgi:hypothetical protein
MDGTFTKQPAEAYSMTVDFSPRLGTGESISTTTVAATKVSDGTTATTTVIESGSVSSASGVVTVPVKAGTDGEDYRIKVTVVTNSSPAATHEADILMRVREW